MAPMIRSASLRGFVPLVEALGGDADLLLARSGLTREALLADEGLIDITAHDLLLDRAAAELDCPDLGLRLADAQDLTVLGPVAVVIEASPTVAEALASASRYMFVHSSALSIGVRADPRGRRGVVALTYRKDLRESPYSPQGTELGLGLFHRVAVRLLRSQQGLRSVELPHAPRSAVRRYTDFFGVDVTFDRPTAALRVERRVLDERFATADESIRRLAVEHLARHHTDPGRQVATWLRRALAESLGARPPVIADAARLLAVHPRTLQRRLAHEGTSFERVLDQVRRDAAYRYLTTTDLPLGQVAALVGFTEQSTLSHAVRRWYGTSPRRLRREAPPAGSPRGLSS